MKKTVFSALLALCCLGSLTACAAPKTTEVPSSGPSVDQAAPTPQASYFRYNDLTPDTPQGQAFLVRFKKEVPQLVGTDRPDKYVLKNGTALCAEISFDLRNENRRMSMSEEINYVSQWVVGGTVTRKATQAEAKLIIANALDTVCPEFK
jgi:hypothetical protein